MSVIAATLLPPLLSLLGPLLERVLPWGARLKAAAPALLAALVIAVALAATALAAWRWASAPPAPRLVLVSEVERMLERARAEALADANRELQAAVAARDADLDRSQRQIEALAQHLEATRATAPDRDRVVFGADDAWLRAKQARAR